MTNERFVAWLHDHNVLADLLDVDRVRSQVPTLLPAAIGSWGHGAAVLPLG